MGDELTIVATQSDKATYVSQIDRDGPILDRLYLPGIGAHSIRVDDVPQICDFLSKEFALGWF